MQFFCFGFAPYLPSAKRTLKYVSVTIDNTKGPRTHQDVCDGNRARLFESPFVRHFPQGWGVGYHVRRESAARHQTEHSLSFGVTAGKFSSQISSLVGGVRVEERRHRTVGEEHVHMVDRRIVNGAQFLSGEILRSEDRKIVDNYWWKKFLRKISFLKFTWSILDDFRPSSTLTSHRLSWGRCTRILSTKACCWIDLLTRNVGYCPKCRRGIRWPVNLFSIAFGRSRTKARISVLSGLRRIDIWYELRWIYFNKKI